MALDVIITLICTMAFPSYVSDKSVLFSNSPFSILFFTVTLALLRFNKRKKNTKRMFIYTHALGFLFSFFTACGYSLDATGEVAFRYIIFNILLFTHIYAVILSIIWNAIADLQPKLYHHIPSNKAAQIISNTIDRLMTTPFLLPLVLLLCWLPAYIADFPGGFRYDATGELEQINHGFNGNYPLLHSAIITRLLPLAHRFLGSYNAGIAIYVMIQMITLALLYSHILTVFHKQRVNNIILSIALSYCCFFPVIHILVVQEVRDVLFSVLVVYTVFLIYLLETDKASFLKNTFKPFILGLFISLTLLARNNNVGKGTLIIIMLISTVLWISCRKVSLKGASILVSSTISTYLVLSLVLTALCSPMIPASKKGALSIMSQSLARAYVMEQNSWTQDEIDDLREYMNLDGLNYCAENADSTKHRLTVDNNFSGFLKFWLKIGTKHPGCYVDAILANTQNMWFPSSIIDGYNQMYTQPGQPYYEFEKCYYSIRSVLESPAIHMNLFPSLLNLYTQIGLHISFEKIPIVSMLFSIGFNFWLVLNCLFYSLYKNHTSLQLPVFLILLYVLLSSLVPLILLRYFAALFLSMPLVIVFTLQPSISALTSSGLAAHNAQLQH